MNNEDVIIYQRVGKLVFFSAVFVIISAAITYFGLITDAENAGLVVIAGIIGMIIFGLCLVYFISRIRNKRPSLIVNDEGITDQSSYVQAGMIRWEEIKDIELYSMMNQRMIGIQLFYPEKFLSKQKGIKKLLMRANEGLVNTPINIAESGLPISIEKLYLIILRKWKKSQSEVRIEKEV